MPELPEVECVRRTLEPMALGRTISSFTCRLPKLARPTPRAMAEGLAGRTITGTARHGKLLMLFLDDGQVWAVHLGMTGQLVFADQEPDNGHVHIVVSFADDGPCLYYRDVRTFGYMALCPDRAAVDAGPLANFGPDALALDRDRFVCRLENRGGKLKSVLLDQRVLAGVGNIYADESLHQACLSPECRPKDLSRGDLERLHAALGEILARSIELGGSSIQNFMDAHGRPGTFQETHRAYRRTGRPCPVCGEPIAKTIVGGRSTHYCPRCQGAPRAGRLGK